MVLKIQESGRKYTSPVKVALITFDIPVNISFSTVTVRELEVQSKNAFVFEDTRLTRGTFDEGLLFQRRFQA